MSKGEGGYITEYVRGVPSMADQIVEGLIRTYEFGRKQPCGVATPGEEIPISDTHKMRKDFLKGG